MWFRPSPAWVPPGNDPGGYYSDNDHGGYYDRNGSYRRIQDRGYRGGPDDRYGPPPPASSAAWLTMNRAAL